MSEQSSESITVEGIAWETAYAGFSRGKLTDHERDNPGFGYAIAYHGGGKGEATVYVYNKRQHDIPDGPNSEMARAEFSQATQEVFLSAQMSGGKMELVSQCGTGSPDRGMEFLCAEFIKTDGLGSRLTFLYLTGYAKNFVKIRVTLRTNDAADPSARDFVDAVASRLWRRATSGVRKQKRYTG